MKQKGEHSRSQTRTPAPHLNQPSPPPPPPSVYVCCKWSLQLRHLRGVRLTNADAHFFLVYCLRTWYGSGNRSTWSRKVDCWCWPPHRPIGGNSQAVLLLCACASQSKPQICFLPKLRRRGVLMQCGPGLLRTYILMWEPTASHRIVIDNTHTGAHMHKLGR